MDKGIYTALSGGIAKSHEIELIANNLANVNTPGFKRDTGTFNEYLTELRRPDLSPDNSHEILAAAQAEGRPSGDKSFVELDAVYTDHRQGGIQKTGRPLDVAIAGEGFFEVLTPSGIRYTRAGNFSLAKDGTMVNSSGHLVLSKGESAAAKAGVQADPRARAIRLGAGPVEITPDGRVAQGGRVVAQINVQEFFEPQWLEKAGQAYFRNTNPDNLRPDSSRASLQQGFMEGSNVNPVKEMTRLIEATRAYESHLQAIKTYQEIDTRSVNEIARRD